MNLLHILFVGLSISTLVQETISRDYLLNNQCSNKPLVLIKKRDSSELQFAKPHEYKPDLRYVAYYYDDSDDGNGPKEKILLACPAINRGKELEIQEKWKRDHVTSPKDKLHILFYFPRGCNVTCVKKLVPSIRKIEKKNDEGEVSYCHQSHAEIYEVGYPVSDDEGTYYQFVPVYKICFSNAEGKAATLYSIHRIESPKILILDEFIETIFGLLPNDYYESSLDSTLHRKKSLESKYYYAYQFVGGNDMPIESWILSTEFLFNYTPITKNENLFKGMLRADYYIRLYSNKNEKPLTLYSGTYEEETKGGPPRFPIFSRSTTIIKYFWRIIIDDEGYAILLVTQHSPKKCGPTYLCSNNRKVKTYKTGGCIYTCSLNTNDDVFKSLDLPPLRIMGDLDFTFPSHKTESTSADKQASSDIKSSERINIMNFLDNATFSDALFEIDKNVIRSRGRLSQRLSYRKFNKFDRFLSSCFAICPSLGSLLVSCGTISCS